LRQPDVIELLWKYHQAILTEVSNFAFLEPQLVGGEHQNEDQE
jgi:hypothetical protein